ncbi:MAG: hypothetical protein Kow002_14400 [Anaerolineales bacterium]
MEKNPRWIHFLWTAILSLVLISCQAQTSSTVTVLENGNIHRVQTGEHVPLLIITSANIPFTPSDQIYLNGQAIAANDNLPDIDNIVLQIRHAVPVTLLTPDGERNIQTAAFTVGQALMETGLQLHSADFINPPADFPISEGMTITYRPAREISVTSSNRAIKIRTAAETVGAALAEAGIPLQNLDYSLPRESEALPADGQIEIVRVSENVQLIQKSIPFESEFIASDEVELDQQQILNPGQPGLAVSRVRIRYENGKEISRQTEDETVIRPPENRVMGYGTKVVVRTTTIGGVQIEYWRALQMYATSYSPCRSGADRCYPGTSSGKPVQKGVVAMKYQNYLAMQGQPLFIPGYGYATVEDVGGGIPGKLWIDLGYSDDDWEQWGQWVTVYFLTPVPASFPYVLDY